MKMRKKSPFNKKAKMSKEDKTNRAKELFMEEFLNPEPMAQWSEELRCLMKEENIDVGIKLPSGEPYAEGKD